MYTHIYSSTSTEHEETHAENRGTTTTTTRTTTTQDAECKNSELTQKDLRGGRGPGGKTLKEKTENTGCSLTLTLT